MPTIPNFPQNLLDMHHAWHTPGAHGGFPSRAIPAGMPGSGLEFLTFHRDYVAQFHAWYDSQPFADPVAVAAWTSVPPQVKQGALGWNANLAGQEQRIASDSPPFASADALGMYIENGIHNWIHGAVASAFSEPLVGGFHSPGSTLFYKIHGLVEHWWKAWTRRHVRPKFQIKDLIDAKSSPDKLLIKEKELIKDRIPDNKIPDKFDKELVEVPQLPGEEIVVNPAIGIGELSQRLDAIEALVTSRPFIRAAERPLVGDGGGHAPDHEPGD